ncbi:BlaI/MecI/CopY family transcriptional regulator [Streptomyces sp. SPB162]|uniref:BlaI/MecI/CopY family transcriptional regulator n=1 Tax=Streptomyces sp. SPB162 TaxID=2940560 RepID=UPI002404A033|nr:BlaI/MecI/CopY family transcriptional regulator [Streptomyces sp. SPB162]MDF9813940.1 putative transcriptional regulator [Streptomyces sp. SPB162]
MPETHPARRPPGELEASVLAALWAAGGPLTPADVQRDLGRALARTTVTTILARLHDKGAVARTRAGRGYAYTPTQDSPGLAARRMRTELDKEEDRQTVLARFVSQLSTDDEQLLRALLDDADPGALLDDADPGVEESEAGRGVRAHGGERGPGGPR